MDLADNKGIWLDDIWKQDIPSSELTLWVAYYKLKRDEQKKRARKDRQVVDGERYGSMKGKW